MSEEIAHILVLPSNETEELRDGEGDDDDASALSEIRDTTVCDEIRKQTNMKIRITLNILVLPARISKGFDAELRSVPQLHNSFRVYNKETRQKLEDTNDTFEMIIEE